MATVLINWWVGLAPVSYFQKSGGYGSSSSLPTSIPNWMKPCIQ